MNTTDTLHEMRILLICAGHHYGSYTHTKENEDRVSEFVLKQKIQREAKKKKEQEAAAEKAAAEAAAEKAEAEAAAEAAAEKAAAEKAAAEKAAAKQSSDVVTDLLKFKSQITLLLAQVKTLEGKLKKICSAKPKPKGC